jgi:hypothetical protein
MSIIGTPVTGLYAGSVVSMFFLVLKDYHIKYIGNVFVALLYLNVMILALNGPFYMGVDIPPLFGGEDKVYEQSILRYINLFGIPFLAKRPTGISDNIHVSGILNLVLCYWLAEKKKYTQMVIACIVLILCFNIQMILILSIWVYYCLGKHRLNFASIIFMFIGSITLFFAIDFFLLDGGYLVMLGNTLGDSFIYEIKYYLDNITAERFFFGIKPGTLDDPYIKGSNSIPVTDVGLLGIPIQHGFFGLMSMAMIFWFWFKYSTIQLRQFIFVNLLALIHYFPMVSLPGIIFISWLVRSSAFPIEKTLFDERP